jgi:NAD/NADP transhydrogenase beta subunit
MIMSYLLALEEQLGQQAELEEMVRMEMSHPSFVPQWVEVAAPDVLQMLTHKKMVKLVEVVVAVAQVLEPHRGEQESLDKAITEEQVLALQVGVVVAKVALAGMLVEVLAEQQEVEQLIPIQERASHMLLVELVEVVQEVMVAQELLIVATVVEAVEAVEIHLAVLAVLVASLFVRLQRI